MPIFALIGGAAVILFLIQGDAPANAIIGSYDQLTSTDLPAIPLFTLAGFLLAEGQASDRLLRLFRAFFGWMPGGTAVVTAILCAFFTLLTGGSGVTILALGGLLMPALLADGYRERFSLGLLTAAGLAGPALSAIAPADSVRHRRGGADRRPVRRRLPARRADAWCAGRARRARRHCDRQRSPAASRFAKPSPRPGRRSGN